MALNFPSAWYGQPPGPIRVAGPWRSRVMSAWYPNAGVDVVRGDKLTIVGTQQQVGGGKLTCKGSNGGGQSNEYAHLGVLASPGDATRISSLTIATNGAALETRSGLFDVSNNGTVTAGQTSYSIAAGYSGSSSWFSYNDNRFTSEANAGTFVVNQRAVWGSSYSKTNPSNDCRLYKNGNLVSAQAYDTAIDVRYGSYPYCIGGRQPATSVHIDEWLGTIELQVLFPPVLSAAEFALLSLNPWQLFEPVRQSIFFGPAAVPPPDNTILMGQVWL